MSEEQSFFSYRGQDLSVGHVALSDLARRFETPLYVYSAEALRSRVQILKKSLRGIPHRICFAVKSNSNLAVLNVLKNAGCGFDVVSGGELYRALKIGADPERIVFSGVGKTEKEIRAALLAGKSGIFSFNVESSEELRQIARIARSVKRKARVAIRYNPDVDAGTHPYISTGLEANKFGLSRDEIFDLIEIFRTEPWLKLSGLSIHIGSQLTSLRPFRSALKKLEVLAVQMDKEFPGALRFMDVGGGLGIRYHQENPPTAHEYGKVLRSFWSGIRKKIPSLSWMVLEPGRWISGNSGVLLTQVMYRKERRSTDFLVVDAAMTDLIRPALYESYHEILPLQKRTGPLSRVEVVGPVCESSDFLAQGRMLPQDLCAGDWLAVMSAGAYGATMGSRYNSRPLVAEVLVEKGRARLIRARENFQDLVSKEKK